MKANSLIAVDTREMAIIRDIVARHLPEDVQAPVFGSRAGGKPKPWSDLDLVLEGASPLSLSLMAELAEAFDDSELPWKVDIVDRSAVSKGFGEIIDRDKIPLA